MGGLRLSALLWSALAGPSLSQVLCAQVHVLLVLRAAGCIRRSFLHNHQQTTVSPGCKQKWLDTETRCTWKSRARTGQPAPGMHIGDVECALRILAIPFPVPALTLAASYRRRPALQKAGLVYRDFSSAADRCTMSWNPAFAAMPGSALTMACRSATAASKVVFLPSLCLISAK